MAILKIVMVVIFTTGVVEAQSAIQPSKLPCKSCMGLEGYVWCGKYQSPFADTWCDDTISSTVCETKVATLMDHCNDKEYDPDTTYVAPLPDEKEEEEVVEPEEDEEKKEPIIITKEIFINFNQMFLSLSSSDVSFYFLSKNYEVREFRDFTGAFFIMTMFGLMAELFKFLKWYISVKGRITSNSLGNFMDNSLEIAELGFVEKMWIIVLFILHRLTQIMMAAQIMISYSLPLIFAACIGLCVGNFLFSGVIGDQVIISRIKRKI